MYDIIKTTWGFTEIVICVVFKVKFAIKSKNCVYVSTLQNLLSGIRKNSVCKKHGSPMFNPPPPPFLSFFFFSFCILLYLADKQLIEIKFNDFVGYFR